MGLRDREGKECLKSPAATKESSALKTEDTADHRRAEPAADKLAQSLIPQRKDEQEALRPHKSFPNILNFSVCFL